MKNSTKFNLEMQESKMKQKQIASISRLLEDGPKITLIYNGRLG